MKDEPETGSQRPAKTSVMALVIFYAATMVLLVQTLRFWRVFDVLLVGATVLFLQVYTLWFYLTQFRPAIMEPPALPVHAASSFNRLFLLYTLGSLVLALIGAWIFHHAPVPLH